VGRSPPTTIRRGELVRRVLSVFVLFQVPVVLLKVGCVLVVIHFVEGRNIQRQGSVVELEFVGAPLQAGVLVLAGFALHGTTIRPSISA
jgi:hypothetical protein